MEEEKKNSLQNTMESLLESLSDLFTKAIVQAYPDIPDPPVPLTTSTSAQFGDYQCNAAMPIAQLLKGQGKTTLLLFLKIVTLKQPGLVDRLGFTSSPPQDIVILWSPGNFEIDLISKKIRNACLSRRVS